MRHFFVVNPVCTRIKNRTEAVLRQIHEAMRGADYDVHVTKWSRDALGACRGYALKAAGETVRVHVLGGTSTHFEAVNGIVDLPNVELALYPMGRTNIFLHYYGVNNEHHFASIEKQTSARVIPIDAFRCNHNYGISNVLIGYEAYVDYKGDALIEKTGLQSDLSYLFAAVRDLYSRRFYQYYRVEFDGQVLDGEYLTILVANQPWYSTGMCPAITDAHPDDGLAEIYLTGKTDPFKRPFILTRYLSGQYRRYPDVFTHRSGKRLKISSDQVMWLSVDGEIFYGNHIEYEIIPGAIRFVYPIN